MSVDVVAYWLPGCSSCLRMKEFLDRAGIAYSPINVESDPAAQQRLGALGLPAPVVCVGDECVSGVDLAVVADAVGFPYDPPNILSSEELVARYNAILDAGCRYIAQMPEEAFPHMLPGRIREMVDVAAQVVTVMRAFVGAFNHDRHTIDDYAVSPERRNREGLLIQAEETRQIVNDWWELDGFDDPLDRVVETYWGYPTLHEVMEREVWHTAQHTRQLMYVLEIFEVDVDGPLTEELLRGLPLPKGIHD
jgi:glutaredoxin